MIIAEDGTDTRTRLLRVAERMFAEDGFDGEMPAYGAVAAPHLGKLASVSLRSRRRFQG